MLYLVFQPRNEDNRARLAHLGSAEICFGHTNLDCNTRELHFQLSITIDCFADNALFPVVNYCLADFEASPGAFILLDVVGFSIAKRQLGQRPVGLQGRAGLISHQVILRGCLYLDECRDHDGIQVVEVFV